MPKPGSRAHTPSDEMARFTDRETQQATFQRHLFSPREPQVLVFYGVGGTGKTWLLRKLREQVPADIPVAYLNFDVADGGKRFVDDPVSALQSIRQQLAAPTPRFELALAMLHHKQGHVTEPGSGVPWMDVAGDILSSFIPGSGPVFKFLSKSAVARLEGKPLERLLRSPMGTDLVIELRKMTDQEIENNLLRYLSDDLTESLPTHLNRAVSCVIFLDTFESVGAGFQNTEHKRSHEKRIQDLAAQCPFALVVIAGQNRISWDEDLDWAEYLDQHLVGGLSENDARQFLTRCDITAAKLQDCILATSKESTGGYHCFSLGLCANIVVNEREAGREPEAETLRFHPQDWNKLSRRFLKSLDSDADSIWIERLALTPRFDEAAARWAYSSERSTAQAAAWRKLQGYSFAERLSDSEWFSIRAEMRAALRNQPSAQERVTVDHQLWKDYWSSRSEAVADDAAGLAWYHFYYLDPVRAMKTWSELAKAARTSVPTRMKEHSSLLRWQDPLDLLVVHPLSEVKAEALLSWAYELGSGSGNDNSRLRKAIECLEMALRFLTEVEHPDSWAHIQTNLGIMWMKLTTGDLAENLEKAIAFNEAALRVRTERDHPRARATTQVTLGNALFYLTSRRLSLSKVQCMEHLEKAVVYYEAALLVFTEETFPFQWAAIQDNLGCVFGAFWTGERAISLGRAIACHEAALRIRTEREFPRDFARTQTHLGNAWWQMPTGDHAANVEKALQCYEKALRAVPEHEFPTDWSTIQNYLGEAWRTSPTGDLASNLEKAIGHYEAALRVLSVNEFPQDWVIIQNHIANALIKMPTGDRKTNLLKAISGCQAALVVSTEGKLRYYVAMTQNTLGDAWSALPTGEPINNIEKALAYYEAALDAHSENEFPRDWAMIQNNIATALIGWTCENRETNLRNAISHCKAALRVFTEHELPYYWAMTHNLLGDAWRGLQAEDRSVNITRAIACYEAATRVYAEQGYSRDHEIVVNKLKELARLDSPL
jgi:tetratricopeptide (TPR) repeat protein